MSRPSRARLPFHGFAGTAFDKLHPLREHLKGRAASAPREPLLRARYPNCPRIIPHFQT